MANVLRNIFRNGSAWVLFLPLLILYSSSYFQRTAVPGMIFDQLAAEIGAEYVPGIGPAFIWIYSLSQLVIGILVDRLSAKRVVSIGGVLFCVGVFLFPLMNSAWTMYLCRMAAGLGAGTMYLSLVRESDRLFGHENYSLMMGVVYVAGYGGGLIGTMPFGRLVEVFSWQSVLLGAAVISLTSYIWFMVAYRKEPMVTAAHSTAQISLWKQLKQLFKNRLMWVATYCGSLNFAVYFTIQTVFGKKLLIDVAKMSAPAAELSIFVMTLVCMGVLFSSSVLTRLIGNRRRPLMIAGSLINLIASAGMSLALWKSLPAGCFVGCLILMAVASGMIIIYSMAGQEYGSQSSMTQCAGLTNMINYFSAVLLTLGAGWWLSRFVSPGQKESVIYPVEAYLQLFVILLVLAAAAMVLVLFLPETKGKFRKD